MKKGEKKTFKSRGSLHSKERMDKIHHLLGQILLLTRWTRRDLSEALGLSHQTVCNWMSGHRSPDGYRVIQLEALLTRIKADTARQVRAEIEVFKEARHAR